MALLSISDSELSAWFHKNLVHNHSSLPLQGPKKERDHALFSFVIC